MMRNAYSSVVPAAFSKFVEVTTKPDAPVEFIATIIDGIKRSWTEAETSRVPRLEARLGA